MLQLLNLQARIVLCGLMHHYNEAAPPPGPNRLPAALQVFHERRVLLNGLIILDYYETHLEQFMSDMGGWVAKGQVKLREDLTEGLENAPAAFIRLLEGRNFGKAVVRVAAT